jgi:hypothetical protein
MKIVRSSESMVERMLGIYINAVGKIALVLVGCVARKVKAVARCCILQYSNIDEIVKIVVVVAKAIVSSPL